MNGDVTLFFALLFRTKTGARRRKRSSVKKKFNLKGDNASTTYRAAQTKSRTMLSRNRPIKKSPFHIIFSMRKIRFLMHGANLICMERKAPFAGTAAAGPAGVTSPRRAA
ncbi:hypothetical protein EVAR_58083_1 [Eumeta japonica]|uniref:Uncharacterized protein n=1 Tax=Eumeta variegata TaxID=151549 RepID=A0A4C1ZCK9_EUMVA|nr:hypothetical protein EVAR_58083_1 [Eumeta japonica]